MDVTMSDLDAQLLPEREAPALMNIQLLPYVVTHGTVPPIPAGPYLALPVSRI